MHPRAKLLSLLATAGFCFACAAAPELTPEQLLAAGKASVAVEDPVEWSLKVPPPLGMRIEITALNGANACYGNRCPTEVTAPAGKVRLSVRCLTVVNGQRLPRGEGEVEGELVAGHAYGLHPLSVEPDCRLILHEAALP